MFTICPNCNKQYLAGLDHHQCVSRNSLNLNIGTAASKHSCPAPNKATYGQLLDCSKHSNEHWNKWLVLYGRPPGM